MNRSFESSLCVLCRGEVGHSKDQISDARPRGSQALVLDDLAAARWVQAYDTAWLGQDWESLASRLAPNVEFVVPSLAEMLIGSPAVLASLRDAMSRMVVHEYNATDLTGV